MWDIAAVGRVDPYLCYQRVVVDWVCTFAHPFVASQAFTVELTGAIKIDTKEKWEAIFRGDRIHDQDAAVNAILATDNHQLQVNHTWILSLCIYQS